MEKLKSDHFLNYYLEMILWLNYILKTWENIAVSEEVMFSRKRKDF
jgi:hypothetical protein